MNPPHITVSYNGGEKMVPLLVHPSLELSDAEVQNAYLSLHKQLRRAFSLSQETTYYLHEVETGRIMSQESYRDPSYCLNFPSHWYMVIEKSSRRDSSCLKQNHFKVSILSSDHIDGGNDGSYLSSSSLASGGILSGGVCVADEEELAEVILPSLADMTSTDTKYHSYTLHGPGDVGCTLRYFSIQPPATSQCSDMLTSEVMFGVPHSHADSLESSESMDALKLSTIFVGDVRSRSEAERVGLRAGFVVHMINKESILRCSVAEIQLLLDQCGDEVTLLGLPQETDELQYLYPTYTRNDPGISNTEDGEVMVQDTPLLLSSVPPGHGKPPPLPASSVSNEDPPPSSSPPVGMMMFDHHTVSPVNSQSCEQEPLSCDPSNILHGTTKTDDILIRGSLLEIGGRVEGEGRGWGGHRGETEGDSQDSLLQLNQLDTGTSPSAGPAPCENGVDEDSRRMWYPHPEEEEGRTASANIVVRDGHKSLEELTRISSAQTPIEAAVDSKVSVGVAEVDSKALVGVAELDSKVLVGVAEMDSEVLVGVTKLNGRISEDLLYHSSSSHETTPSDTSQHSDKLTSSCSSKGQIVGGVHLSGSQVSRGQLSDQSVEGILSPYVTALNRTGESSSSPKVSTSASSNSSKRAVRGYKSQRAILHRTRNRSSDDPTNITTDQQTDHSHSDVMRVSPNGSSPISNGSSEEEVNGGSGHPLPAIDETSIQKLSSHTSSKLAPTHRFSVVEAPMRLQDSPMHIPRLSVGDQGDPFAPLFTTRTALTPSGEQVVREVNIEDAIRRSQVRGRLSPYSQGHAHSQGDELSEQHQDRLKVLQQIICRGLLAVKQDGSAGGRRSQDRAWGWRDYYAVLIGTQIKLYKEKKEAYSGKGCEEPALEVVPATIDPDPKNTRRKFAFRLMTERSTSYLLQADDAFSRQHWVDCIQRLNGRHDNGCPDGPPPLLNGISSPNLLRTSRHLFPVSPKVLRRVSSPTPPLSSASSKSTGTSLLDRIKRTLTRSKEIDELDYSSFTTFNQPLQDCPVSPENKKVPLVVEFCVCEVEKHGLDVEGIYRKPGLLAMINQMSAQMDKGNYMFEYADYGQDIHTCGSLLKKFLKELPDPLIPNSMYPHFLACARLADDKVQLSTLKELVHRLPTAHYHTLRYLIRHLVEISTHCGDNKMTLRNVALVFGPTVMRGVAGGDEMLNNMTAGYTIVELFCRNVEYLCEDELCLEEVEKLAAAAAIAEEDEKLFTRRNLQPAVLLQKEQSLSRASPRSLRRSKNKLTVAADNQNNVVKRLSALQTESLSHSPNLLSWSGSGSNSHSEVHRGHHTSVSSLKATSSVGDEESGKKRVVKHMYEDVEIIGSPAYSEEGSLVGEERKKEDESHTMSWINHHREMNWGRESNTKEREMTGSLWSSRNREQQQLRGSTSGEKLQPPQLLGGEAGGEGKRGRKVGRTEELRELFTSYQGPAPQHSFRSRHPAPSSSSAVKPRLAAVKRQTLQPYSSFSPGSLRRTSYVSALESEDVPVREATTKHSIKSGQGERFANSEHVSARYQHGNSVGNSHERGQKEVQTGRYAWPSPSHFAQHRVIKHSSLPHNGASCSSPSHTTHPVERRRSSESVEVSSMRPRTAARTADYYHQHLENLQQKNVGRNVKKPHRTLSNDRVYGKGNSPPSPILSPHKTAGGPQKIPHLQRQQDSPITPVESYI